MSVYNPHSHHHPSPKHNLSIVSITYALLAGCPQMKRVFSQIPVLLIRIYKRAHTRNDYTAHDYVPNLSWLLQTIRKDVKSESGHITQLYRFWPWSSIYSATNSIDNDKKKNPTHYSRSSLGIKYMNFTTI